MKFLFDCTLITFIVLCVPFTSSFKYRPCVQNGPCACVFPDGKRVNISKLAGYDFGWIKVNATTDIFFQPCVDKGIGDKNVTNECFNGTSMCFRNQTGNETDYYNLGNSIDGKFSSPLPNQISLQFTKGIRKTIINFQCNEDRNSKPNLTVGEVKDNNYVLTLHAYESCVVLETDPSEHAGLSFGSVLVLAFVVFSLVYFVGGVLTLKFLRGAEGKEMIPNYEFWADLPYLIRDGVLFVLNGCQQTPSYDRI